MFPEGLGGRLKSTTTVCNDCNNSLSNIEGEICLRLASTGALVGARRGDRKHISTVVEHADSKWRTENGRMDELAGPPRERGSVNPLPARHEDQVALIAEALRSRRLPAEALIDGRLTIVQEADGPPVDAEQTQPIEISYMWGDAVSRRVMIKIAVELLAHVHPSAARLPDLERARRFARYGEGQEMDFPARIDIMTNGAGIPPVDAMWFHGIDVWTSGRKLNYRIVLFSLIRWVGTITGSWTGPMISASYTFDVTDPKEWKCTHEPRDGATLVNKSRRVRAKEYEDAATEFEKKNLAKGTIIRASMPTAEKLYPDVKALMTKRGNKS